MGVVLIGAATLKLAGLADGPLAATGVLSSRTLQAAVLEFEVLLAAWLLIGANPVASWLVTLGTFASFASVSLYLLLVGDSSCGCFGRLSVHPSYSLGLDLLVLTAAVLGRPIVPDGRLCLSFIRTLFPQLSQFLVATVMAAALFILTYYAFGSRSAAIALIRGDRLSIQPELVDVGVRHSGDELDATVDVLNLTARPMRLIGGTSDCSCTVLNDLPITIPAHEFRPVTISLRITGSPGILTRKLGFVVDDDGLQSVTFRLTGRIVARPYSDNRHHPGG